MKLSRPHDAMKNEKFCMASAWFARGIGFPRRSSCYSRKRPYMDRPEQFLVAIGFFAFYRFCIRARERTSEHHVLARAPSLA